MFPRSALGLAVLLILAAACGEIPEPESFAIATSSTVAETDTAEDDEAAPEPEPAIGSDDAAGTEFVPSRDDDYIPEVLLSTDTDVLVAGVDGLSTPLADPFSAVSAATAVDDFTGGLAVQSTSTGAASGPGPVLWLRAEGGEPVVVDEEGALLLDVGYVDGSPTAIVLTAPNQIDRIRLVDDERTELITLGEEEELVDLSASGSLYALVLRNDRCGDLRFYGADGREIDLNGPGEPDCIVPRRPAYGAVALSPDGGAIAYTKVRYRDDGIEIMTELVARELSTGVEYFRQRIGEEGERVTALSFDGDRVAYLRTSETDPTAAVIDLNTSTEVPIDLAGLAGIDSLSFTRLPLAGSQ